MSEQLFQNIIDTLPLGIMIFDVDENLVFSNSFAEKIFSDNFNDSVIITLTDMFDAINKQREENDFTTSDSFTIIKNNVTLIFSLYSVRGDDSDNYIAVKIVNISGQKNSLIKQEKQVSDLLWKTRSRLANLLNAHEIIASGIELESEVRNDIFNSSRVELFQIGKVVDNFRELTLINSNLLHESLEMENVDLSEVIAEAIKELEVYASSISKHYAIQNKCLSNTIVFVDRYRTLKVIESLLLNALVYSNSDVEISIDVNITPNYIKLFIKDNGWGIPDDEQASIFTYTFRGNNASRSDHNGIGSELFICRQILTKMNCEITFYSKEREGSEFIITFPNSSTGIFYL